MKTFVYILFFTLGISAIAQTTAIPDNNFEQALINIGIDSDGTVNGQVLTSDIVNVSNLYVANYGSIQDMTGIEDFSSLKILDVSYTHIGTLNLSGNPLLEELYCNNGGADVPYIQITELDLSNHSNIQIIEVRNIASLKKINLKTGTNNNMAGLYLNISRDLGPRPAPGGNFNYDMCIQIDDENAAQQNLYPYSSWTIDNTYPNNTTSYEFSENCYLGIEAVQQENLQTYPNPVKDFLFIQNPNGQLEKIEVYDVRGKRLKSYSKDLVKIDMQSFAPGIYFLKIYSNEGASVEKVVKE